MRRCLVHLAVVVGMLLAMSGSAAAAARLYVPAYGGGPPELIGGFDRGADGSLVPIAGSPFPAYGSPFVVTGIISLAFTPDGGRAASAYLFSGGAQGMSVAANGGLAVAGSPVKTASATGLAITPDGRFAYTPTREFPVGSPAEGMRAYSIGSDGSLTPIPMAASTTEYQDVAITPDGRFLYTVTSGNVARFAINVDGTLSSLGATIVGGATQLVTSPDGRLLLVGRSGVADGVASYSIGADGSLSPNGLPALTGDVGMDYFAVAPDGGHIYMPDGNLDAIVTAAVAPDGKLTVIGSTPVENAQAVAVSPDGRYLYFYRGGVNHLGTAAIAADGLPSVLPLTTPWTTGEAERLIFQPEATPLASFTAKPAAPGAVANFDASKSARAARFDWDFGDGTTLAAGGPVPRHVYSRAGVYQVTLTVTDDHGCSTRQIYTGQSTTCPGGSAATSTVAVDTLPAISALTVSNRRFSVAAAKGRARSSARPKRGTTFRYRLTEAAKVRFKIERKLAGRIVGGKCRPITANNRKRKHCVRFRKASPPVLASGKAGANRTPYSGRRRSGKALPPGRYRARAVATDPAGGRSAPRYVSFRVVAARR